MGFDPNEPRDAFGKWVESASAAAGVAMQQTASDRITKDPAFRRRAIRAFSKENHVTINAFLNNPTPENEAGVQKIAEDLSYRFSRTVTVNDVISGIDNYLEAAPKYRAESSYRGLNFSGKPDEGADVWTGGFSGKEAQGKYNDFKTLMQQGNTFTDKGYMSSSANKGYAERFTHTSISNEKGMTTYSAFITVKDSRGVDITHDSHYSAPEDRPAGYQYIMHERNSKWKVTDVKEETINGQSPYKASWEEALKINHINSKRLNVSIERIN